MRILVRKTVEDKNKQPKRMWKSQKTNEPDNEAGLGVIFGLALAEFILELDADADADETEAEAADCLVWMVGGVGVAQAEEHA